MSATVCTCIGSFWYLTWVVAVPDPQCPAHTESADDR